VTRSPFLESARTRRRAAAQRRARARRRALAGLALFCALAGAAVVALVGSSSRSGAARHPSTAPAPAPALRHSGFALDLHARNVVSPPFHRPPRAGLLFDLDSGRVLWQRDATRVLPIASLTKMMTALLVVRHGRPREAVPITKEALAYRGSGVGLLPRGKRVQLETLLYGLLLPSGNDAAIALAQHVAGSVPRFVGEMNAAARELGLRCSHFTSPDGFDDANRSCAADLAVLARADLAEARLARVTRSRSAVLPFPIKGGRIYLYNNNPLVRRRFPGVTGLKTGETNAAGKCLVATASRHGVRLGAIVLRSPDLARQSAVLLDAGFRAMAERSRK
jgi:D-alanyl-D-alanine carboxypeptidase